MITWILNNIATILISIALIALITFIVVKKIIDKKNGKSSCSCGCDCGACNCCKSDKDS